MTPFRSPDGTMWGVEVRMPSHSGALVIFHHPGGETARFNRYAWLNARSADVQDPRARLAVSRLAGTLDERTLARLFRRSMPVSSDRPSYIVS
jgi:hypothetical protein